LEYRKASKSCMKLLELLHSISNIFNLYFKLPRSKLPIYVCLAVLNGFCPFDDELKTLKLKRYYYLYHLPSESRMSCEAPFAHVHSSLWAEAHQMNTKSARMNSKSHQCEKAAYLLCANLDFFVKVIETQNDFVCKVD